jgi:hypothetical protein
VTDVFDPGVNDPLGPAGNDVVAGGGRLLLLGFVLLLFELDNFLLQRIDLRLQLFQLSAGRG